MDMLKGLLDGKKTYLLSALSFVVGGLWAVGLMDDKTALALLAMSGSAGMAALRAGVTKSGPDESATNE